MDATRPASRNKLKFKTEDALTGKSLGADQEALGCATKHGSWQFTQEPADPQEFFDFANASEQARNYDPDDSDVPPLTIYQAEILKAYAKQYPYLNEFFDEYEEAIENAT